MKLLLIAFAPLIFCDELLLVQVFHRHGSKIPEVFDPDTFHLWQPYIEQGYNMGHLSPLGELEMQSVGELLRERYIDEEQLLPSEYDMSQLRVRASSWNPRPLRSSGAMMRGLYPGAPVPLYTTDPRSDTLMVSVLTCPSHVMHWKRIWNTMGREASLLFPELYRNFTELTGFKDDPNFLLPDIFYLYPDGICGTIETCPAIFAWLVSDSILLEILHGLPPEEIGAWKYDHEESIRNIYHHFEATQYRVSAEDVRGPLYAELIREVIDNIQTTIDGRPQEKMKIYSFHSNMITAFQDAMDLPERAALHGHTYVLELRRRDSGEHYLKIELWRPDIGGETILTEPVQMQCPSYQDDCSFDDFMVTIGRKNELKPPDQGCCFKGQQFFNMGCGDYLNPGVLDIPECIVHRRFCPQTACGEGQIVDSSTLLCVPIP